MASPPRGGHPCYRLPIPSGGEIWARLSSPVVEGRKRVFAHCPEAAPFPEVRSAHPIAAPAGLAGSDYGHRTAAGSRCPAAVLRSSFPARRQFPHPTPPLRRPVTWPVH